MEEIKEVTFYTTSNCQLNCEFCPKSKMDIPNVKFDLSEFKRYADMLKASGIKLFELSPIVGDTLLDDELIEKIKYCKSIGVKTYFFTNLVALSQKFLDDILKFDLVESTSIVVSIYGSTSKIFTKRTNTNMFNKFEEKFKLLMNTYIKKQIKIKTINIRFDFDFKKVDMTNYIEKTLWTHNLIGELDISINSIDINWNTKLINVKDTLNVKADEHSINGTKGLCGCYLEDLGIWPNGDIGICSSWFDINKRMILGNLNGNTFNELTCKGSVFRQIEAEQHQSKYRSLCKECSYIRYNINENS